MQFISSLRRRLIQLIVQHTYLAMFSIILLEEAGVPMPLPGDSVMVFSGYLVSGGRANPFLTWLSLEVATIIGASILFWIARWGGRPILHRYGKYFGLDNERVTKIEGFLKRRGVVAIVIGRVIPGLRIPTSIMSGALNVPYKIFLPSVALGSSIYTSAFFLIGLGLGNQAPRLLRLIHTSRIPIWLMVLVALAVIVGIVFLLRRIKLGALIDKL